jgi:hypothetical protein
LKTTRKDQMKRQTKKATVAAACPYCEKSLKQPGWAPHVHKMHADRPFLPFGSTLAQESPKAEAKATVAAACPYCEKSLKQLGWAPHVHKMHADRPFLPFGSTLAQKNPKAEAEAATAMMQDQPKATEHTDNRPVIALAETDGAHAADAQALIVKIQERIAYLDVSIANVKAMQEERERLAVALAGLSQVLSQLTGKPPRATAASL